MAKKPKHVTLKTLAEELGMDRSHLRKFVLAMEIEPIRVRVPESRGQATLAVTPEEAALIRGERTERGFSAKSRAARVKSRRQGMFYAVQLMPAAMPRRVKAGFSADPQARLTDYRCCCPNARLLKAWPCKRSWEQAALAAVESAEGVLRVSGEIYDVENVEALIERIDSLFDMLG